MPRNHNLGTRSVLTKERERGWMGEKMPANVCRPNIDAFVRTECRVEWAKDKTGEVKGWITKGCICAFL